MLTGEYDYSCTVELSEATAAIIPGARFQAMTLDVETDFQGKEIWSDRRLGSAGLHDAYWLFTGPIAEE